jgi:hypothetical protein
VASEWVAGVAGVVGAAVGASATLTGNWIATRAQLKLAVDDREQQRAEIRRGVCAEYLVAVDSFMDQARELVARLENDAPEPELDDACATYRAGWVDLQRRCAPVVIAGPAELGQQAERLEGQLGAVGDVCDSWYAARKKGPTRSRDGTFVRARDAARTERAAFVSAAQKHALRDPAS